MEYFILKCLLPLFNKIYHFHKNNPFYMHIPYISLIKKSIALITEYYTSNIYGGIILMSNFDFLQISRNFKSYYQTLHDVHYYLTNDSDLSEEELQAVSKVLSKLI